MRGTPYVFSEFSEGVNLEGAPYSLDIGQGRESFNFHTSPAGSLKKRYGCPKLASPEVTLTSLFGCQLATDILLGAGGKKIFKISTTGTVTSLKEGLTENLPWEWIKAPSKESQGPFFGVNGTDTPQYWDGAAAETKNWTASAGSVPNGKFIIYHENRVYIAKESTLYWSSIINPRDWASPNGGSTQVDPEDGQEITGLGKVGPYLLIFKNRKTFMLLDSNSGAYRRISNDIGCGSNRSIVETSSGTFFMSSDSEIIVTDGSSFSRNLNQPIRPYMKLVTGALKEKVCGGTIGDSVYFSISREGSINDTILEYDLVNQSWWPHKVYYSTTVTGGVNQFALLDPSSKGILYGAGSNTTTKRVFEMFKENTYTDNESISYKAYWLSPWHVYKLPHLRKRMREVRIDSLGTFVMYAATSFSSTSSKEEVDNWESAGEGTTFGGAGSYGGTGTYGDEVAIQEKHYYTLGVGRAWSFKFESEDQQDLQIYSYSTQVDYKKD